LLERLYVTKTLYECYKNVVCLQGMYSNVMCRVSILMMNGCVLRVFVWKSSGFSGKCPEGWLAGWLLDWLVGCLIGWLLD